MVLLTDAEDGNLCWFKNFFSKQPEKVRDDPFEKLHYTTEPLFKGPILSIGGNYANRYCIVDESAFESSEDS